MLSVSELSRILVIAPHQDDEIIGCGGTILRLVEMNASVLVVHVFSGNSGTEFYVGNGERSIQVRHREAQNAAELGGYTLLDNLGFRDREAVTSQAIIEKLVELIRKHRPTHIFAPHEDDGDFEHRVVASAATEAAWLCGGSIFSSAGVPITDLPMLVYFEVWRPIREPNLIIDINAQEQKKRKLLACFTTQMNDGGWTSGSIGLNAYRGATHGSGGYAEAFCVKQMLWGKQKS